MISTGTYDLKRYGKTELRLGLVILKHKYGINTTVLKVLLLLERLKVLDWNSIPYDQYRKYFDFSYRLEHPLSDKAVGPMKLYITARGIIFLKQLIMKENEQKEQQ